MIPRSQVSFGISHGSYASRRAVGSVYSALGTRRTRRDRAGGDLGRRDQGEGKTKAAAGEWRHGSKSRAGKERVLMKKCCWRAAPPPPPPPPGKRALQKDETGSRQTATTVLESRKNMIKFALQQSSPCPVHYVSEK